MSNSNNNDDTVYKESINSLNSESTPSEILGGLDNIVDELIMSYSNQEDNFIEHNTSYGCLNFALIFNECTQQQMYDLFESFCCDKNIEIEQYTPLFRLFKFHYHYLKSVSKEESKKIEWADFMYQLNPDINSSVYEPTYPANLSKLLKSYTNVLTGYDKDVKDQPKEVQQLHRKNTKDLINVFYFETEESILRNDKITEILAELNMQDVQVNNKTNTEQLIANLYFGGITTQDDKEKIKFLMSEFYDTDAYSSTGYIIYNLVDSLIRKDKEQFLSNVEDYTKFYWSNVLIDDSGNFNRSEYNISKLSLNDKIVLFFTDYFKDVQLHGNFVADKFIDLLFTYYDQDIFHAFMDKFEIPYNIAIRIPESEILPDEEIDDDEPPSNFIEQNTFSSLFEYALINGLYEVALDIYRQPNSLDPFYAKVIEEQSLYEYSVEEPFMNLNYAEEDILFLIANNIITKSNNLLTVLGNTVVMVDPFFYCLSHRYNQAFIKLYYKSKEESSDFKLKDYQTSYGIFGQYLDMLIQDGSDFFNPAILEIFYKENYSILEKNAENISIVDIIKNFPVDMGVHLVILLEPFFERENFSLPITKNIAIKAKDIKSENITWFDKDLLADHLQNLAKDKDNSNTELIKSMLLNNNHIRKSLNVEDESFFNTLEAKFPNFKDVINFYKAQFRFKSLSGKNYIPPIMLLGEAGIGKTLFAKELAQHLNTGYTFLDMASLTASWILTGNNGSWKSAKQGKILDAMLKSKTANPIVLLDEMDKAKNNQYDPTTVFYQLLEPVNAKDFSDEFIDFSFDASGIIYIACANSTKNMSEPLLSRFKVFNIKKPNDEETVHIIKNIYAESIKDTNVFNTELPMEFVDLLKEQSFRSIRVSLDDAVSSALLEYSKDTIQEMISNQQVISLEERHIKNPSIKSKIGF